MQTGSICLSLFVLLEKPAEGTLPPVLLEL